MNQNKGVSFLLKNLRGGESPVGSPVVDMGDTWRAMMQLVPPVERIIFYNKERFVFCSIQWVEDGHSRFYESYGKNAQEALFRNVIKALHGDDAEILGDVIL